MSAGTITLTNNSDAVAGAGTAFLTDLAPGDFIVANVGGIAYTLPVKAIASATALTIINKFTGPTLSGLAWFIVKREQQAMITAALVVQNTEALRVLSLDKSNWQAVFSVAGDITVTLPDNTQFTGPSWKKIVTLLAQSDIEAIQPLVDQVRADALQVAADKTAAQTAKTDAQAAKESSETAASTAGTAKTDAVAAKDTAQTAASTATSQASASEASAKRAEEAASTIDTTAFLRKDGNLAGLADKSAARTELEVYSKTEVDAAIKTRLPLALGVFDSSIVTNTRQPAQLFNGVNVASIATLQTGIHLVTFTNPLPSKDCVIAVNFSGAPASYGFVTSAFELEAGFHIYVRAPGGDLAATPRISFTVWA